jgi:hypothetical protein
VVHQQPSGRLIPNLIKPVIIGVSELNKLLTLWLSMDQALKSLSGWVWEAELVVHCRVHQSVTNKGEMNLTGIQTISLTGFGQMTNTFLH